MTKQVPQRARHVRNDSGQGMTEYIIIVVLVAIAAIGVVTIFGDNIRDLFAGATRSMSGEAATKGGANGRDATKNPPGGRDTPAGSEGAPR